MQQLKNALDMIPPGVDLLIIGAMLAFGTKSKTVQWIALGVGGARLALGMTANGV